MFLIRVCLIVFVAVGKTTELLVVTRLVMTGGATFPLAIMFSGKNRKVRVVLWKIGRLPGKQGMTFAATSGKSKVFVDGVLCAVKVGRMTGVAFRRQDEKLALDFSAVAGFTIQSTVRPQERKGGLLVYALLIKNLPALRRMAAVAIVPQPALMDIQMAIDAGR